MKKYRLKKDLPTFKAGDVFTLHELSGLYKDIGEAESVLAYSTKTLRKFPNILKDWFEEIPEGPKTIWDLKDGDVYYYFDLMMGGTVPVIWRGTMTDNYFRRVGNVFLTKEDCEKEVARWKAKQVLLKDTKGYKLVWEPGTFSYEVCINSVNNLLFVGSCCNVYSRSDLWFATEEDAEDSIRAHEKEWRIWLGVEE